MTRRRARTFGACTRGAAAVEFAIVSSLLIMLLIGTIDFGRAWYVRGQLSFLADQAARRVLIQPMVTDAELATTLREAFTAGDPEALAIEVTIDSAGGASYRILTIEFPLTLFIPYLDSGSVALNVTRRIPAG